MWMKYLHRKISYLRKNYSLTFKLYTQRPTGVMTPAAACFTPTKPTQFDAKAKKKTVTLPNPEQLFE